MAAGVAARRSAGAATRVLEQTTGGCAAGPGVAGGSAAAPCADVSRCGAAVQVIKRVGPGVESIEQARERHALYDAVSRVANIARPVHRTGRRCRWDTDCESSPRRD